MIVGTSAGVGFAIPSSTVVKIVPQLIQLGRVSKGKERRAKFGAGFDIRRKSVAERRGEEHELRISTFYLESNGEEED